MAELTPAQVAAGKISLGQLARQIFGQPMVGNRVSRFVEIDVSGLPISNPAPNIFLHATEQVLDLTGRIRSVGATFGVIGK